METENGVKHVDTDELVLSETADGPAGDGKAADGVSIAIKSGDTAVEGVGTSAAEGVTAAESVTSPSEGVSTAADGRTAAEDGTVAEDVSITSDIATDVSDALETGQDLFSEISSDVSNSFSTCPALHSPSSEWEESTSVESAEWAVLLSQLSQLLPLEQLLELSPNSQQTGEPSEATVKLLLDKGKGEENHQRVLHKLIIFT